MVREDGDCFLWGPHSRRSLHCFALVEEGPVLFADRTVFIDCIFCSLLSGPVSCTNAISCSPVIGSHVVVVLPLGNCS